MRTEIKKTRPMPWSHVINDDGMVWDAVMPKGVSREGKYRAHIPDARLDHCSFECFGFHTAWADTLDELIADIKALGVPYYSDEAFFKRLRRADAGNTYNDRQVELYYDGRGTTVTRGELTYANMTDYTSF
ncbi:MAG: hypothetical protein K6E47_16745 [Lachnospiraceae bacterium]|nr:hypothetical protein [Lachnospiraceae bacterium]